MRLGILIPAFLACVADGRCDADWIIPLPKSQSVSSSRIALKRDGTLSVGMLHIDGKPYACVHIDDEGSTLPAFYWLNDRQFVYQGCDTRAPTKYLPRRWHMGALDKPSSFAIDLAYFDNEFVIPVFAGALMAYQGILDNRHLGCFVYDWNNHRYLLEWDTEFTVPTEYLISMNSPKFSKDLRSVACSVTLDWDWDPEGGEGQSGELVPINIKTFRHALDR